MNTSDSGTFFFARQKGRLAVRKTFSLCAFLSLAGLGTVQAQHIPPYHGPGAEGQYSNRRNEGTAQGRTFGPAGGRYIGGPTQYGPAAPSYWTYNRFSNNGFGGLNWYYGPLGGYTPYINPYGSAMYGYPSFGPYYSYVPLAPVLRQTRPYWIGGDPFANIGNNNLGPRANPVENPQPGAALPGDGQPAQQPVQSNIKVFGKTPTNDAIRRSIRYQAQGDEWFAKQNYLQAYGHYKQAIAAVPGRAEPRFRMALALAATTNYASAVDEIKRAMRMDPSWPHTGPQLDELFGADNIMSKNAVLHKVAAWVRSDIRDPDRLFLMGVLLHFNDDPDQSHTFFEAASALAPVPAYALAFLEAQENRHAAKPAEEPRPAPLDDETPLVEPAQRDDGPRFPPAAGLDVQGPVIEPPAGVAQPQPSPPGKRANAIPKVFRSPPAKVPEEPRPRPLAAGGCGGAPRAAVTAAVCAGAIHPGSWA
jgi:tetratricopeptide (TPR) repeat protein